MKVALYVTDGTTQIVLTPENDYERRVAQLVLKHSGELHAFEGEFYECQGGWYRQGVQADEKSIILRLDAPAVVPDPPRATEYHGTRVRGSE